jgi:hypothetical protein
MSIAREASAAPAATFKRAYRKLGQPEKAIGLEPQIEPWLTPYNHTACPSETERRRHASKMNLQKREHDGSSLHYTGWMSERISPLPPVAGEVFLDIPLYRTRLPDNWDRPENQCPVIRHA